jgi:hypothetical protein
MQPPTDPPRSDLTLEQVVALIQDTPSLSIRSGLEIITQDLGFVEDITDDFISNGSSVERSSFADLHGSCVLKLSRALDWGNTLVRPYVIFDDLEGMEARFNLGAYFATASVTEFGEDPGTFDVTGFDILLAMQDTVGEAYSIDAGESYLTAAEDILRTRGYTEFVIDATQADKVLPVAKTWALDENITWMTIVNELMAAIGYQGIWSDWQGRIRLVSYTPPIQRIAEWRYTDAALASMLGAKRSLKKDYFSTPNRWVAVRSNLTDEAAPIEGEGVWTYTNETTGNTSVEARGGRTITRYLSIDAVDQASLMSTAQISIDADMRVSETAEVSTAPNPLHWHFDRMTIQDDSGMGLLETMSTKWTLPLNGDDMTHEWSVVSGL